MQQITGRLIADATIKQLESGKQVVSFNVAENQSYRPKGSDEIVDVPTYFNCSYWMGTGVTKVLRKGAVVQLNGRVSARAYSTNTGDLAASLNFHTSRIEVLSYAKDKEATDRKNSNTAKQSTAKKKGGKSQEDNADDLPF